MTEKEKELGSGFFVLAQTFPSPAGAGLTVLARVELPRTAELHFPVLDIRRDQSAVSLHELFSQKSSREGLVLRDTNANVKCETLCANCNLARSDFDRWDERTC